MNEQASRKIAQLASKLSPDHIAPLKAVKKPFQSCGDARCIPTVTEFFQGFEENKLASLFQDETKAGDEDRFSNKITRNFEEAKSRAFVS